MGKKIALDLYLRMTAVTEFGYLLAAYLLLRPLVQLVAIETADVIQGMGAGIPVAQYRYGLSGVALHADQGLGLGGEIHDVEKSGGVTFLVQSVVAFRVIIEFLNGQTSRAMA